MSIYDDRPTEMYPDRPASMYDVQHANDRQLTLDSGRLWAGGIAAALVAGLVGLVGMLLVRVVFDIAAYAPKTDGALGDNTTIGLCVGAALAALAATALIQLLIAVAPQPRVYFGWIAGLGTAAAVLVPLLVDGLHAAPVAEAIIHLVIGIAISTLVAGSAAAALRRR